MDDRVSREKEAWNEGFDRSRFEALWQHAGAFWDEEVDRLLRQTFAPYGEARFLEVGSSTWHSWIWRLRTPHGQLDCINISETEIENGRHVVDEVAIEPTFHVMDAHKTRFDDGSFDVIFGKAILHHLDYDIALREVDRLLKPGGVMVFMEPLDFNPIMKLVRFLTPGYRTPDEAPISGRHLPIFNRYMRTHIEPVQFVSAAVSPLSCLLFKSPRNFLTRGAWQIDRALRHVPGVRLWFRSGLIIGRKMN